MNSKRKAEVFSLYDGDIRVWIEQEAIHMKAVDHGVDPVEMTGDEARKLAAKLIEFAEAIDE